MKVVIRKDIDLEDVDFCNEAFEETKLLGWQSPNSFIRNYANKFYNCYTVETKEGETLAIFGIRENNNKIFYFSTKYLLEKNPKEKINYIKKMKNFIDVILTQDYNILEVEIPNKKKYGKLIKLLGFKIVYQNDFIKIGVKEIKKRKKIDLILNKAI